MNLAYRQLNSIELTQILRENNDTCAVSEIKFFDLLYEYEEGKVSIYFCAFNEERLVGVAKLKTGGSDSISAPGWNTFLCSVSVRDKYYGNGIGQSLLNNLLSYCAVNKLKVIVPAYSVRGWKHLRQPLYDIAKELNVEIFDQSTMPTYFEWKTCEGYNAEEYDEIKASFSLPK